MKRVFAILGLLAVALVIAVWRAPASLLAGVLPPEISRVVQLHQASGTIWRGSALFSLAGVPPSLALAWSCRPSISPLGVRCELSESASALITVDLLSSALRAERVSAALPIQVATAGAVMATSSNVVASFSEILATRNSLAIKGNLRAVDASYRVGSSETSLGEVTMECAPTPDALSSSCSISNRGGTARLDGKLLLTLGKASGVLELTPGDGPTQRVVF